MKKFFALVFTIIMTFSFSACGKGSENQVLEEEPGQEEQVVNEQEPPTEESNVEEPAVEQSMIDEFIEKYNATASNHISSVDKKDTSRKTLWHNAFRLNVTSKCKISSINFWIIFEEEFQIIAVPMFNRISAVFGNTANTIECSWTKYSTIK